MATRIQEGGGGMGSSGSFKAKVKAKASKAIVSTVKGKKAGAATAAASSRNSVKAAEARAAVKAAKSKPPLATPKSGVTVTKRPGTMAEHSMRNTDSAYRTGNAGSGASARLGAAKVTVANANAKAMGKKTKVIKINK